MREPEPNENQESEDQAEATRVFFCTGDGAHKFWRAGVVGTLQVVAWGRIGTAGQILTRPFETFAAAKASTSTLIAQKTAKGYVEVSAEEAASASPVPVVREKAADPAQLCLFDEPDSAPAPAAPPSLFE